MKAGSSCAEQDVTSPNQDKDVDGRERGGWAVSVCAVQSDVDGEETRSRDERQPERYACSSMTVRFVDSAHYAQGAATSQKMLALSHSRTICARTQQATRVVQSGAVAISDEATAYSLTAAAIWWCSTPCQLDLGWIPMVQARLPNAAMFREDGANMERSSATELALRLHGLLPLGRYSKSGPTRCLPANLSVKHCSTR